MSTTAATVQSFDPLRDKSYQQTKLGADLAIIEGRG